MILRFIQKREPRCLSEQDRQCNPLHLATGEAVGLSAGKMRYAEILQSLPYQATFAPERRGS